MSVCNFQSDSESLNPISVNKSLNLTISLMKTCLQSHFYLPCSMFDHFSLLFACRYREAATLLCACCYHEAATIIFPYCVHAVQLKRNVREALCALGERIVVL